MISLRSIFVVLVLAQIAASAIGSIVGSFLRTIIVPCAELLIGSVGEIMIGWSKVSDFISTCS